MTKELSEDFINLVEELYKEISEKASDRKIPLTRRKNLRELAFKNYMFVEQVKTKILKDKEKISLNKLLTDSKISDKELCNAKGYQPCIFHQSRIGMIWKYMLCHKPYRENDNKIETKLISIAKWSSDSIKRMEYLIAKILNAVKEEKSLPPKSSAKEAREGYELVLGE